MNRNWNELMNFSYKDNGIEFYDMLEESQNKEYLFLYLFPSELEKDDYKIVNDKFKEYKNKNFEGTKV